MLFSGFWRCCAFAGLALLANGAFAQSPRAPIAKCPIPAISVSGTACTIQEITRPIDATITLQVGETRSFQFGEATNRVDLSEDNIVEATSVQDNAFAFKGIKTGRVFVTSRSEDGSEVHRMQIVVGGKQVKVYSRDEPDYLSVYCDEFGCGPSNSSKPQAKSATVRTPTGGGGFVERNY